MICSYACRNEWFCFHFWSTHFRLLSFCYWIADEILPFLCFAVILLFPSPRSVGLSPSIAVRTNDFCFPSLSYSQLLNIRWLRSRSWSDALFLSDVTSWEDRFHKRWLRDVISVFLICCFVLLRVFDLAVAAAISVGLLFDVRSSFPDVSVVPLHVVSFNRWVVSFPLLLLLLLLLLLPSVRALVDSSIDSRWF